MVDPGSLMTRLRTILALLVFGKNFAPACTIFILTDEVRALFCNNED